MRKIGLTLAALAALGASAFAADLSAPPLAQQRNAINLMRMINTAESWYFGSHHKYARFEELVASGAVDKVTKSRPLKELDPRNTAEPIPGVKLRLVVSAEGDHYQAAILQSGKRPSWGAFSDEQGLIYRGEPLQ